jgi:hypothetical protein
MLTALAPSLQSHWEKRRARRDRPAPRAAGRSIAHEVVALDHVGAVEHAALEVGHRLGARGRERGFHQDEGRAPGARGVHVDRVAADHPTLDQRLAPAAHGGDRDSEAGGERLLRPRGVFAQQVDQPRVDVVEGFHPTTIYCGAPGSLAFEFCDRGFRANSSWCYQGLRWAFPGLLESVCRATRNWAPASRGRTRT